MLEKHYLFPECYVAKIPKCDDCLVQLKDTGTMLMSNPPIYVYKCPKCNKEYNFNQTEIQGEWRWRTL